MKLQLKEIGRCDKGVWRVQDVSCCCETGKVIGLIGNNGAGKTTLLKILAGQLKPTAGNVQIMNDDGSLCAAPADCTASCIFLDSGYPNMTGHEMMCYIAQVNRISSKDKIQELEERWGVPAKKKVSEYSLGMKVRLNLAMTMLKEPRIMLLDEVFNGLDPSGQLDCRNILMEYAKGDRLVMISSHSLYDIAEMSDEIIFMESGRIVKVIKEHIDIKELAAFFYQSEVNPKHASDTV